jgi:hypothetical protein
MRGFNFSLSGQLTALPLHKGSQIHAAWFAACLQPNSSWRVGQL